MTVIQLRPRTSERRTITLPDYDWTTLTTLLAWASAHFCEDGKSIEAAHFTDLHRRVTDMLAHPSSQVAP